MDLTILVLVAVFMVSFVQCDINTLTPCIGQLDDGRLVDLSPLNNPEHPMIDASGDYDFKYNPCEPIRCEESGPVNAAVCKESKDGKFNYTYGVINGSRFSLDAENHTVISYPDSQEETIKSVLTCICGKGKTHTFKAKENLINQTVQMNLTSPCCCPNRFGCKKEGLTEGDIFAISFIGLFIGSIIFFASYRILNTFDFTRKVINEPSNKLFVTQNFEQKSGFKSNSKKTKRKRGQYAPI